MLSFADWFPGVHHAVCSSSFEDSVVVDDSRELIGSEHYERAGGWVVQSMRFPYPSLESM